MRMLLLFVLLNLLFPTHLTAQIEMEVNNTPSKDDDYFGWAPVPLRVKSTDGMARTVKLVSSKQNAATLSGEVQFASGATRPTPATFMPVAEITLSLPTDGTWTTCWVAGKLASSNGKDVEISVLDSASNLLLKLSVMVRVRKNAEKLNDGEIKRFLDALAKLHDLGNINNPIFNSGYLKYVEMHARPDFRSMHLNPGFLPWHRAMLLSFERDLQKIDATVSLPYWKFDQAAPKVFSEAFMGRVDETLPFSSPNRFRVAFSGTNPIQGWGMPSQFGVDFLQRDQNADGVAHADGTVLPDVDESSPLAPMGTPARDDYRRMWSLMEQNYHNDAHSHIGGWLGNAASPRDPLFFLLHANVDRAWAQWQKEHNRFQIPPAGALPGNALMKHYALPGGYPGPTVVPRFHAGMYAEDTMWPWNSLGGGQGTVDTLDDWPVSTFPMPPAVGTATGPVLPPRVRDMINYWDPAHDFSYDVVLFK